MVKDLTGRRFGVRVEPTPVGVEFAETRGPVVEDVDAGAEIGEAGVTCQPILIDCDGEQHVLFAGTPDLSEQKFTAVDGHPYPIRSGAWLSFPQPFRPGMVVTVTGLDANRRELFRCTSLPLHAGRMTAIFGPGWTAYAPLDE
jgi:hypothetical protein